MDKEKIFTNKINIVFLALICTILWGSAFPAVKVGYELFNISTSDTGGKLLFAGYRFFLAGIFILIAQLIMKKNIFKITITDLKEMSILGIGQTTMQYMFFYIGMSYTTGVKGSIINGTSTFLSILLAHIVYKNDKLNFNKIIGCIVGFLGVVVINLNGDASSLFGGFKLKGEGFMFISALILAICSIYSKKISQNKDAYIITGYQLAVGGLVLILSGYCIGGILTSFTVKSISLLIYMALLSSVSLGLWAQLLKYNKVGVISVFNFLIPVFGTILSGLILKENIFDIKIVVALILVCIGIFLVYKRND